MAWKLKLFSDSGIKIPPAQPRMTDEGEGTHYTIGALEKKLAANA